MRCVSTSLKLKLLRGDKVIVEVPLSILDWPKEQLETEFEAFEEDFKRFSCMFDALSNMTRIKMMRKLIAEENRTITFAGFMHDLDLNPKTVWENLRKLRDGGFLKKTSRGTYHCSEFGQSAFLILSLILRRILDSIEEV
jgi:hypothetical protein